MSQFPQAVISGFHKHFLARCVTALRVLLATVFLVCFKKTVSAGNKSWLWRESNVSEMEFLSWHLNFDLASRCALNCYLPHVQGRRFNRWLYCCLFENRPWWDIHWFIYKYSGIHIFFKSGEAIQGRRIIPIAAQFAVEAFSQAKQYRVKSLHFTEGHHTPTHTHTKHTCRPANFCLHTDIKKDIWKYGIRLSLEKMTQAYAFIYVVYMP